MWKNHRQPPFQVEGFSQLFTSASSSFSQKLEKNRKNKSEKFCFFQENKDDILELS